MTIPAARFLAFWYMVVAILSAISGEVIISLLLLITSILCLAIAAGRIK